MKLLGLLLLQCVFCIHGSDDESRFGYDVIDVDGDNDPSSEGSGSVDNEIPLIFHALSGDDNDDEDITGSEGSGEEQDDNDDEDITGSEGSGEEQASTHNCTPRQFPCSNGKCISCRYICDGDNDCGDGSDEDPELCSTSSLPALPWISENHHCSAKQFTCDNGQCIQCNYLCDGDDDCGDTSDENPEKCNLSPSGNAAVNPELQTVYIEHVELTTLNPVSSLCGSKEFQCGDGKCIVCNYVCDGDNDCPDSSDEDPAMCNGIPNGTYFWISETHTCSMKQFTCGNGNCVSCGYACDGDNDCEDESDESPSICEVIFCGQSKFKCKNNVCIDDSNRCDGVPDCSDGSDEGEELCGTSCAGFLCNNGNCIRGRYSCDGDNDCGDRSDEDGAICGATTSRCSDSEFSCNNGNCIRLSYRCDGDNDCGDRSDEDSAICQRTNPSCSYDEFACNNGRCIRGSYRCDGDNDCEDNSDEAPSICQRTTPSPSCDESQFTCKNGNCIRGSYRCDGDNDCGDRSDEEPELCETPSPSCDESQFTCKNGNCIRGSYRCDGDNDCGDRSDEEPELCAPRVEPTQPAPIQTGEAQPGSTELQGSGISITLKHAIAVDDGQGLRLDWRVESSFPVLEHKISYKNSQGGSTWEHESTHHIRRNKRNVYNVSHKLRNLKPGDYDVVLKSRNTRGWSKPNRSVVSTVH